MGIISCLPDNDFLVAGLTVGFFKCADITERATPTTHDQPTDIG